MTAIAPPRPIADPITQPFWQGVAEHRLVLQRCATNSTFVHPPEQVCPCCGGSEFAYVTAAGTGTVHSFAVMRDRRVRGYEERVPYVNLWVDLDEQPGLIMLANLVGGDDGLAIGARVDVEFETFSDGSALPAFRLI